MNAGRLIGVGLGPGDPELVTLKAARALAAAPVVAWFHKRGRTGHARTIADGLMPATAAWRCRWPTPSPPRSRCTSRDYAAALAPFYEEAAATLATHLDGGRDVALLCEGDPLFFGSFMHLYVRLRPRFATEVIPGISGMSGCWSAAGLPMSWGDDVLTVLPGTLPFEALRDRLAGTDAAVIMKLGSNFAKVREAVEAAGLMDGAVYVERGTMAGEVVTPLRDKADDTAPYFSIVLLPGHGRRP